MRWLSGRVADTGELRNVDLSSNYKTSRNYLELGIDGRMIKLILET